MNEEYQEPETINLGEPEGEIHTVNLWVRLGDFIIDYFIVTYLIAIIYLVFSRVGYNLTYPALYFKGAAPLEPNIIPSLDQQGYYKFNIYGYLNILMINYSYYFIMETLTGQTIGKIITRTQVVNRYGEKPLWWEIALRTLCRFIPFCWLSFIPNGISWYDRISQTYVKQKDPLIRNF